MRNFYFMWKQRSTEKIIMSALKILLIGSGGREHALARALAESASCEALWAAPGNPGIFQHAKRAEIDANNFAQIGDFCVAQNIDFVLIGPDQALADGMTDALLERGIKVFGPTKAAARIEWSKAFSKELMQKAGIPTAAYASFSKNQLSEALEYLKTQTTPIVVKADGLALGKGVIIAETHEAAQQAVREMFDGAFSSAGDSVVIEEFLSGEEASVFALCDGQNYVLLAPAQDHKRALDGDRGKNTGGMGTYAPAGLVNAQRLGQIEETIIRPLLSALASASTPFVGCLFVGLMIKDNRCDVVEFNARFGDPETQSVLSVFRGDFAKLCYSAACGAIDPSCVESVAEGVACTVILASGGYPDAYEKGFEIRGLEEASRMARIYHAGTVERDGTILTSGGRVLGITAVEDSLSKAIEKAYAAAECVQFEKKLMRRDIGQKGLRYDTVRQSEENAR